MSEPGEFGSYPLKVNNIGTCSIEFMLGCLTGFYKHADVYADLTHERVLRVSPKLLDADLQYFRQACPDIVIGDDIPGWEPGPNNI